MIWIIVFVIIGFVAFRFLSDVNKDKTDLIGINLQQKFAVLIDQLNFSAFDGKGEIIPLNKRSINLYQEGQNQIINFFYGTGHLTITWKYKYYQKEVVHEKVFHDVRNLSIFEQQKIAEIMINEMTEVIINHQNNVLKF